MKLEVWEILRMLLAEYVKLCLGEQYVNTGLRNEPPAWRFEYEFISCDMCIHKAFVYLFPEEAEEFINKIERNGFMLEHKKIYQRLLSYEISGSAGSVSAIEIEIRCNVPKIGYVFENIEEVKFKLEEELENVKVR